MLIIFHFDQQLLKWWSFISASNSAFCCQRFRQVIVSVAEFGRKMFSPLAFVLGACLGRSVIIFKIFFYICFCGVFHLHGKLELCRAAPVFHPALYRLYLRKTEVFRVYDVWPYKKAGQLGFQKFYFGWTSFNAILNRLKNIIFYFGNLTVTQRQNWL